VLNGIAYDALHNRIFVTGKQWPAVFEIKVIPKPKQSGRIRSIIPAEGVRRPS